MGVKELRAKDRRNRFIKRRGGFQPLSEESSADPVFVDNALRKFWSQRQHAHQEVDKSAIPEGARPMFEYRKHAVINKDQEWLDAIFPGVKMTSEERKAAQDLRRKIIKDGDPKLFFVVSALRTRRVVAYFTAQKDCWFLVERTAKCVRRSDTAFSKDTLLLLYRTDRVRWRVVEQLTVASEPP